MAKYTFVKQEKPLAVLDHILAKDMNDVRKHLAPMSRIEKVAIQINKGAWAYGKNWMGNIYPNGIFIAPSGKKYMINADGTLRPMIAKKTKKKSKKEYGISGDFHPFGL